MRFRVTPNLQIAIDALVKKAGERLEGEHIQLLISEGSDRTELELTGNSCTTRFKEIPLLLSAKTMSKRHGGSWIPF